MLYFYCVPGILFTVSILCTGCACQLIIKENNDDDDDDDDRLLYICVQLDHILSKLYRVFAVHCQMPTNALAALR